MIISRMIISRMIIKGAGRVIMVLALLVGVAGSARATTGSQIPRNPTPTGNIEPTFEYVLYALNPTPNYDLDYLPTGKITGNMYGIPLVETCVFYFDDVQINDLGYVGLAEVSMSGGAAQAANIYLPKSRTNTDAGKVTFIHELVHVLIACAFPGYFESTGCLTPVTHVDCCEEAQHHDVAVYTYDACCAAAQNCVLSADERSKWAVLANAQKQKCEAFEQGPQHWLQCPFQWPQIDCPDADCTPAACQ